tara:strand:- start:190 stop:678 length:489 start_codon:yes stop_codon:yes gene_type:complete
MAEKAFNSAIVGHGEESPEQLLANPRNAKIHPKAQQRATEQAMERVGWIDEVTVNKRTGMVLDGHMRVAIALRRDEETVPVRYVDLSPEDELIALRTFDPLGSLAAYDDDLLDDLSREVAGMDGASGLLDDMGVDLSALFSEESEPPKEQKAEREKCPLCGK